MKIGRRLFLRVLGFFILMATWKFVGTIRASPALPSPDGVMRMVIYLIRDGTFRRHIGSSIELILFGIGMAIAVGFITGILISRYEWLRDVLTPVVECVRGIASLTLFPLLIILFGLGTYSRIFVIFWTAWPPVMLSTINSLDVDSNIVDAARTYGAGEWRTMISIRIPMSLQGIITGIRIGAGSGWISLITAEMLGASKGLGFYLLWNSQSFEFEKVYATIIIIAAIGGLMNYGLLLLQRKAYKIIGVYQ